MTTIEEEEQQLRHKIVELRKQRGHHLIDESDYIEGVMTLYRQYAEKVETRAYNAGETSAKEYWQKCETALSQQHEREKKELFELAQEAYQRSLAVVKEQHALDIHFLEVDIAHAIGRFQGLGHPDRYLESRYPNLVSDINVTNKEHQSKPSESATFKSHPTFEETQERIIQEQNYERMQRENQGYKQEYRGGRP